MCSGKIGTTGSSWHLALPMRWFGASTMFSRQRKHEEEEQEDCRQELLGATQYLARLSARGRAAQYGLDLPEVRGINHTRSNPYMARNACRIKKREYEDWRRNNFRWTPEGVAEDKKKSKDLEAEWDEAERISFEAGFEFWDRRGVRQNVGVKPEMMVEIVKLFLSQHGHAFKFLEK